MVPLTPISVNYSQQDTKRMVYRYAVGRHGPCDAVPGSGHTINVRNRRDCPMEKDRSRIWRSTCSVSVLYTISDVML